MIEEELRDTFIDSLIPLLEYLFGHWSAQQVETFYYQPRWWRAAVANLLYKDWIGSPADWELLHFRGCTEILSHIWGAVRKMKAHLLVQVSMMFLFSARFVWFKERGCKHSGSADVCGKMTLSSDLCEQFPDQFWAQSLISGHIEENMKPVPLSLVILAFRKDDHPETSGEPHGGDVHLWQDYLPQRSASPAFWC